MGKGSEVGGISELKAKAEGFMKIKPETGVTFEQGKSFLEDLFKNSLSEEVKKDYQTELTAFDRLKLGLETGWSKEVLDCIQTREQADIYKKADLEEKEINGRMCLVKQIDMGYYDKNTGMTNRELMGKGRAPIDVKTDEPIELHHMGQNFNAPFAELAANSEHGDGNHSILHPSKEDSWRQDPEKVNEFNRERAAYWKARVEGE